MRFSFKFLFKSMVLPPVYYKYIAYLCPIL